MDLKELTYRVLVVSASPRFDSVMTDLLSLSRCRPVRFAAGVNEAKRALAETEYDFIIINTPLPEGSGLRFAIDCTICAGAVVLLLVGSDHYPELHDKAVEHGIFILSKPMARGGMITALDFMSSTRERLRELQKKSVSVEERMEEIRMINRAKWLLIDKHGMTEPDAHRYIEKTAMNTCTSRKEVARRIIQADS